MGIDGVWLGRLDQGVGDGGSPADSFPADEEGVLPAESDQCGGRKGGGSPWTTTVEQGQAAGLRWR